jgi:DNA-binding NarL/FixJ family response regulator
VANYADDMPASRLQRAIVVDRLPLARMGMHRVFETEHVDVIEEFSDARPALDFLSSHNVDFVVMGSVADMHPVNFVRALKKKTECYCLVLIEQVSQDDLGELVRLGTAGLLLRNSDAAEFSDSIRRIRTGERVISGSLSSVAQGEYESVDLTESENSTLTKKEAQVLRLMAEGKTNRAISDELFVTLPTTKTHVAHILTKLDVKTRGDAVARALEIGLLK